MSPREGRDERINDDPYYAIRHRNELEVATMLFLRKLQQEKLTQLRQNVSDTNWREEDLNDD